MARQQTCKINEGKVLEEFAFMKFVSFADTGETSIAVSRKEQRDLQGGSIII